jgi:hypothetical protein
MWNPLHGDVSKDRHEQLLREAEHYRMVQMARRCGGDVSDYRLKVREAGRRIHVRRWLAVAFRSRRAVDRDLTEEFPQMIDLGANGC